MTPQMAAARKALEPAFIQLLTSSISSISSIVSQSANAQDLA